MLKATQKGEVVVEVEKKKPIECLNAITCPLAINDCKRKEVIVAATKSNFVFLEKKLL